MTIDIEGEAAADVSAEAAGTTADDPIALFDGM